MDSGREVTARELPFVFECRGEALLGIVHTCAGVAQCGVLIVVGGPQYRVGSHRQFICLARALAAAGIPAMRFDCRGMGDSGGESRTFEDIDDDIVCALDAFLEREPRLRKVVLWGLCDAASAILMYADRDPRVAAAVLCNPWVHTEQAEARVRLKRYYLQRLASRDFWRKVFGGKLDIADSWASLAAYVGGAAGRNRPGVPVAAREHFVERMRAGLARFERPVFLILSGDDMTAEEFRGVCATAPWSGLYADRVTALETLAEANHTFSRADWRDAVAARTIQWVQSLDEPT